jgi:hypothetical protein
VFKPGAKLRADEQKYHMRIWLISALALWGVSPKESE